MNLTEITTEIRARKLALTRERKALEKLQSQLEAMLLSAGDAETELDNAIESLRIAGECIKEAA